MTRRIIIHKACQPAAVPPPGQDIQQQPTKVPESVEYLRQLPQQASTPQDVPTQPEPDTFGLQALAISSNTTPTVDWSIGSTSMQRNHYPCCLQDSSIQAWHEYWVWGPEPSLVLCSKRQSRYHVSSWSDEATWQGPVRASNEQGLQVEGTPEFRWKQADKARVSISGRQPYAPVTSRPTVHLLFTMAISYSRLAHQTARFCARLSSSPNRDQQIFTCKSLKAFMSQVLCQTAMNTFWKSRRTFMDRSKPVWTGNIIRILHGGNIGFIHNERPAPSTITDES